MGETISGLGMTFRERSPMVALALVAACASALAWSLVRSEVGRTSRIAARIDFDEASAERMTAWLDGRAAAGDFTVAGRGRGAVSVEVAAGSTRAAASKLRGLLASYADDLGRERSSLEQRIAKGRSELDRLRDELSAAASRLGGLTASKADLLATDPENGQNRLRLRHDRLAAELEGVKAQLAAAGANVASIKKSLAAEPRLVAFHPPLELADAEILELAAGRRRLREMAGRLDEMLKVITELHPFAVDLTKEIAAENARLAPLLEKALPEPVMRPNPKREKLAAELPRAGERLAALAARSEALGSEAASLGTRLPELERALAEAASLRAATDDLGAKLYAEEMRLAGHRKALGGLSASAPSLGRVTGPPELLSLATGLGLAGALAAGLVVAAAGVLAGFTTQKGFMTPGGLKKATGLPVLAAFAEEEIPYGASEPPAAAAGLSVACAALAIVLGWLAAGALAQRVERAGEPIRLLPADELPAPGDISPAGPPRGAGGAGQPEGAATPEGGSPGTEAAPGPAATPTGARPDGAKGAEGAPPPEPHTNDILGIGGDDE